MDLTNKNILIVGLARSGLAAARFCAGQGGRVVVSDQKSAEELGEVADQARALGVELRLGEQQEALFTRADLIVLSPGVPHTLPQLNRAREKGIAVIGEMELASRFIQAPMVAITGTNGKSTVTKLIGAMARAGGKNVFVGGNLGNPLTHCIDMQPAADLAVVEVSSFQLDTIESFHPTVAVLLNITEDHQDRYDDMAAYAASKGRIFENMDARDTAVINAADGRIVPLLKGHDIKRAAFGLDARIVARDPKNHHRAHVSGDAIEIDKEDGSHLAFDTAGCALMGPHNMENIAASCLAALGAGLDPAAIQAAIDDFKGLPHRLERVGTINGVQFINDSKATNVDAVMRALECFATPVVIIMGGRNKGNDFSLLQGHVRRHVASLVAIGEAQKEILTALSDACPGQVVTADSMAAALQYGQALARPGQSVLLAPGCASFDMFDSYAHRGDVFRQLVGELS